MIASKNLVESENWYKQRVVEERCIVLWKSIVGQDEIVGCLKKSIKNSTLSHAYLFVGPRGVGKYTTAKTLAAALNCESHARLPTPEAAGNGGQGCGECSSCRKTREEVHPDVFPVVPEGNFITIGQIRELQHEAYLKPLQGKFKLVLIDEADRLNEQAANALLKILEDPPANLIFVLVAENIDSILPTISSRCQIVHFKAIPIDTVKQLLIDKHKISLKKADLVARLSDGILGEALNLIESDEKFSRRQKVLDITEKIPYQKLSRLLDDAERLILEAKKPLEETKTRQKQGLDELKKFATSKKHLAWLKKHLEQKNRRQLIKVEHLGLSDVLRTIASWYRDLLVINCTSDEKLVINIDKIDKLKIASEVTDVSRAKQALDVVLKTKAFLRSNVNVKLAFEVMLMKLQEVC